VARVALQGQREDERVNVTAAYVAKQIEAALVTYRQDGDTGRLLRALESIVKGVRG
jgi:hypothetical protein